MIFGLSDIWNLGPITFITNRSICNTSGQFVWAPLGDGLDGQRRNLNVCIRESSMRPCPDVQCLLPPILGLGCCRKGNMP